MHLRNLYVGVVITMLMIGNSLCATHVLAANVDSPGDELSFINNFIDIYSRDPTFDSLKGNKYSKCQKTVLEPFLLLCVNEGMESVSGETRMVVSIQMAICDYEAAKTDYPKACITPESRTEGNSEAAIDVNTCLSELIKNPSLYNVYHSYLLSLGSICKEESLPFEKDQIITLFSELTRSVVQLSKDLRQMASSTEEYMRSLKIEMMSATIELRARVEHEWDDVRQKESQNIRSMADNFMESFSDSVENISIVLLDHEKNVREESSSILKTILDDFSEAKNLSGLFDIKSTLNDTLVDYFETIDSLHTQIKEKAEKDLVAPNKRLLELQNTLEKQLSKTQEIMAQQDFIFNDQLHFLEVERVLVSQIIADFDMATRESWEAYILQVDNITNGLDQKSPLASFSRIFRVFGKLISYSFISSCLMFISLASFSFRYLNRCAEDCLNQKKSYDVPVLEFRGSLLKRLMVGSLGAFAVLSGSVLSKRIFDIFISNCS